MLLQSTLPELMELFPARPFLRSGGSWTNLSDSFLTKHAGWIGPLDGIMSPVRLTYIRGMLASNIGYLFDTSIDTVVADRFHVPHLCEYIRKNQASISSAAKNMNTLEIDGPVFYFCSTKNVYGHWILEMLPAIVIYHYYIESQGVKLVLWDETNSIYLDYIENVIGVRHENIMLLPMSNKVMRFAEMYSVDLFHNEYLFSAYFHTIISEMMRGSCRGLYDDCEKIFISRRKFQKNATRTSFHRNEIEFETMLEKQLGYVVLHPQEMPLAEQIAAFARCRVLLGLAGSGLHNSIFMSPGARVICIGFNRVQLKLAGLKCHITRFIFPHGAGKIDASDLELFDLNSLRSEILTAELD